MHRSYALSPTHYAANWTVPSDDQFNIREDVNTLAIHYASLPDGPLKEDAFLTLVKCFHGYLIKYTNMVIRGHLPSVDSAAGNDATQMLKKLLPKEVPADQISLSRVCRTLHLAFKTLTTDEVYDVMVMCFLRACHKYDPKYTDKIKQVCEVVDEKMGKQFTPGDVSPLVGFDAAKHLRFLVSKGYLASILGPKRKVLGYKRTKTWPPEQAFFKAGPVGFTYYVQRWFRYYVSEYISKIMAQIETKQGMLQLNHQGPMYDGVVNVNHEFIHSSDALPHADGNFVDQYGVSWAADTSLMHRQLDVSEMTDAWVVGCNDKFFRNLSTRDRWIMQMLFRDEFNWVQVAAMLECSTQHARQQYNEAISYLRGHLEAKAA